MGRFLSLIVVVLSLITLICGRSAEAQSVSLQVSDVHNHPMHGAVLSVGGKGSTSPPTDVAGKTELLLPQGVQPGDSIALILVRTNPKDLMFLSPWHGMAIVPKPAGFIGVVLGKRGDTAALANEKVLASFATALIQRNASPEVGASSGKIMDELAKETGFRPSQVDRAIRQVLGESNDSFSKDLGDRYLAYYPTPGKGGNEKKWCNVHIDNNTQYVVEVYVGGKYAGTVGPWGDSYQVITQGVTELYSRTLFTDGSALTYGPKEYRCSGGDFHWKLDP